MLAFIRSRRPSARALLICALLVLAGNLLASAGQQVAAGVQITTSSVLGSDGHTYSAVNHLVPLPRYAGRREWLLVWAGDAGTTSASAPDFLAVIDATKNSPTYGKVANTAVLSPQVQSEPHHMQYIWHKGDRVYAGSMFSDTTFVLDVSKLPEVRLTGINLSQDTPCGSVPDAFWVLKDGTAYGSYLGGPDVSGPCTYTDGQVRTGNGFAGTPGEVVHISQTGKTLSESPAATAQGEDPNVCHDIPALPQASCANPHGIQAREDLNRLITSDFAEVRDYLNPDTVQLDPALLRSTVRIWDISNRNDPRLVSVSYLPDGPRPNDQPYDTESRMAMETTVTNLPWHRGAFASTMAGGVIYYTPDITNPHPVWREVFDNTTAYRTFDPSGVLTGQLSGGSWLQTTPDDRYLFHAVMGSDLQVPRDKQTGMIFVLDIQKLLASGENPQCKIDTVAEVSAGGSEWDCPALVGVLPMKGGIGGPDGRVNVGPHWGAMDNFVTGWDGYYHETSHITRIATSDYFVAVTGIDGDHKVCISDFDPRTGLTLDTSFRDEVTHQPCVDFDRTSWPHGNYGDARPHGVLFVVADKDVR